jgi:hypothetical protein
MMNIVLSFTLVVNIVHFYISMVSLIQTTHACEDQFQVELWVTGFGVIVIMTNIFAFPYFHDRWTVHAHSMLAVWTMYGVHLISHPPGNYVKCAPQNWYVLTNMVNVMVGLHFFMYIISIQYWKEEEEKVEDDDMKIHLLESQIKS